MRHCLGLYGRTVDEEASGSLRCSLKIVIVKLHVVNARSAAIHPAYP